MEIARLQIAVDSTQAKNAGKDLQALEGNARGVAKEANMMGKAIGAAVAAFATGALVDWITATTKGIAELDKFSRLAGSSVEQFQAVAFGAARYGVEADKLSDVLKDVNDKVGDFLQTGAGEIADFFEKIAPQVGVTAEQFRNLSGPDALQLYVSSLEKANLSQQEMTFYMEAIANDATLLIPLFADGGAELSRFADQAERLGLILEAETVEQARQFNESLGVMQAVSGGLGQQIVAQLLPTMNDLTGTMIGLSTETELANTAAEIIGGTLKALASVGIVVGAAFQTTGQAIGATAAAMVAAANGDFKEAWSIIEMGSDDYVDGVDDALNRVEGLWDGTAAETARAAAAARLAMRDAGRGAQEYGSTAQSVADGPVKNLTVSLSEGEKAAASNAKVIAGLAESLYQATLPADALAKRQAELRLNQYATPEQISQVNSLADALYRMEAKKAAGSEFEQAMSTLPGGESPELERLRLEYQEKQLIVAEAYQTEYLNKQMHDQAMLTLDQAYAAQRQQIMDQSTAQQQAQALQSAASIISITSTQISTMQGLFDEGSAAGKAFFVFSQALAAANAVVQGFQSAMAIRVAYAQMAAMSGPAAPALLAAGEIHANVAMGMGVATAALIGAQTVASFDGGGFTGAGSRSGGMDGKGGFMAMLHPNETVIDHTKGQGMGGAVTVNVIESRDKAGTQQTRTSADGQESVDVFVADIYGDGPRARAMQSAFGLQRQGR